LDAGAEQLACELEGTDGGMACDETFCGSVERINCVVGNGQYNSSGVCEPAGRNKVIQTVSVDPQAVQLAGREQDNSPSASHTGKTQRVSGRAVSGQAGPSHGVVTHAGGTQVVMEAVGQAPYRSVCHEIQQQDGCVCVSTSGSHGVRSGRALDGLESSHGLRVPSHGHTRSSVKQARKHRRHVSHSSSAGVGEAKLVRADTGAPSGGASRVASLGQASTSTSLRDFPQQSRGISTPRLEAIQQAHQDSGFSEQVARRMARGQKPSTIGVYNGKWKGFSDWCDKRKADPFKATGPVVADFLCYLHQDKHLALSTIEGYKTAIAGTLRAVSGIELGKNSDIGSLLANFARDTPTTVKASPKWDLSVVLKMLTGGPFEPLEDSSLKWLTLKTVFLLALASGRRRGELHALLPTVRRKEDWSEVTLDTEVHFVAKTALASGGVMAPLTITALTEFLSGGMEEDVRLCPVRALKAYLERTKDIRQGKKLLFVSYKPNFSKDIARNTVSHWIKKLILYAYKECSEEDCKVLGVKAHDVRGLAASWALYNQATVEAILSACSWKSHSTFSSFYLQDLTRIRDGMMCLGPVVVALHST